MLDILVALLGLFVGILIGLTGIGGGSLTTPLLILFGIQPIRAVGTDLIFNSVTKLWGSVLHVRKGNLERTITAYLIGGSLFGIGTGYLLIKALGSNFGFSFFNTLLNVLISALLIVIGISYFLPRSPRRETMLNGTVVSRPLPKGGLIVGSVIGLAVQMTSIGSGSLLMPYLLRSVSDPRKVVGTDLAVGLVMSLLAGATHYGLGTVDNGLLLSLVLGSLPGVTIGVALNGKINIRLLRRFLAALMIAVSFAVILKALPIF